uniref:Uncharacterized protein n=1 Tax=Anguilla anguilla TaxID=7936 RepID=A0A0E9WFN5_ANGAN
MTDGVFEKARSVSKRSAPTAETAAVVTCVVTATAGDQMQKAPVAFL